MNESISCSLCKGTGWIPCPACSVEKEVDRGFERTTRIASCSLCKGRGEIPCRKCKKKSNKAN